MTVPQGAAVSIGAVLGTGVIALPALGAQAAGPASLLAWAALILLSVPLAATFAALGARYPDAGGVSTYVRTAFGARAATVVGWCFYLAVPAGAPPAAMFGGAYVAAVLGGGMRTTLITSALMIVAVTVMNAGGVRISGRLQLGMAAVLVTLLLTATLSALPHGHLANLHPFAPHGWLAIGPAAAVLVWGFAGWEAVTSLAADFRHPQRDVPRASAVAVVVVGLLYLGVAGSSVLVLGPAAATTQAPLAELLAIGLGAPARIVTAAVAVLLTLGAMNAYFAGAARLGAALGRDGALPAWFARGSSAGEIPRRSLATLAALSGLSLSIVAATGAGARAPALLATGSFVLVYVLSTAAAVRLLPRRSWSRRAAAVALAAVSVLLVMNGWYVLWALAVAAAALLYAGRRTRRDPAAGTPGTEVEADRPATSRVPSAS
ncbi:MAG TPA: amino acid permease [Rugosimonospora sp.]|jgi:amino acid efflux transporter